MRSVSMNAAGFSESLGKSICYFSFTPWLQPGDLGAMKNQSTVLVETVPELGWAICITGLKPRCE